MTWSSGSTPARLNASTIRCPFDHTIPFPAADRQNIPVVLARAPRSWLELYGSAGQLLRVVEPGMFPPGRTERSIDVLELQNGVYQYVVHSGNRVQKGRITVMH